MDASGIEANSVVQWNTQKRHWNIFLVRYRDRSNILVRTTMNQVQIFSGHTSYIYSHIVTRRTRTQARGSKNVTRCCSRSSFTEREPHLYAPVPLSSFSLASCIWELLHLLAALLRHLTLNVCRNKQIGLKLPHVTIHEHRRATT